MARARNIKPGMYKNEDLAECSIWARYIFPGLWMLADRDGRLEDRPKRIKGELLPFDTQDVEILLAELASKKDAQGVPFIVRYRNSDGSFIQISKFSTHQTPHYSEKKSVIKPPTLQESERIKPEEFQECETIIEGELREHSEKPPIIKGGSQPPDSLIHRFSDSPNPDSPKKTKARSAFAPPGWVDSKAWQDFENMRAKTRKPMTDRARELVVRELEKLKEQGHDPVAVLEQSVRNGWQDVFPLKDKGGNGAGQHQGEEWWRSEAATNAKAAELGMHAYGGESWNDFRGRIRARIAQQQH